MTTIQQTIQTINSAFDQAFNAKQADKIAALYADNAVVMPAPAGAPVIGTQALQEFFTGLIGAGVIEHQLTLLDAVEDGNLAYQRGTWGAAMIGEDGAKQTFGGNVHLVYRKQADGQWKAVTHIWN
jgi:ketosteroid isomerase-like protein